MTAVRSQMPVAAAVPPASDTAARQPLAKAVAPVSDTQRKDAPVQAGASGALVATRLAERDESDHPAAEARIVAEAARKAYIQASLVAGVNPLPLP